MPISIEEYRTPEFSNYKVKQPFSEDVRAKFDAVNTYNPIRRYRQDYFPQAGYNPNANSANVIKINLDRDDLQLPSY